MIQCPTPNSVITKYKPKVVFGLTLRQLICGALGIAGAIFGFFVVFKDVTAIDNRAIFSAIFVIPFFFIGWGSIYGQPVEKVGPLMIYDNFILPAVRKKEIHWQALEEYEKTPKFFLPSDDPNAKPNKKKKQNNPQKIKVRKSATYKAIK